ncbi:T6SS effector BTH_I2691 family protein [Hafnia paralvei]|uniref:T6SS effector BTH_I2691 family protein n=1 Tax=Hafnia paralvei TaxID=546367 RepID=UPI0029D5B21A|nr:T6SS effector BTH_I2691 family protein [Hafnia paralvei]MDX6841601.1 T6SS effector BTH_I2691 family protein [Hafnia paralvei]
MATTDNVISAKPCTSAKGRIPLVPVRYGIVPKKPDDTQQFAWEGCGFTLEEGFTCIAELHCSKYTLRALRGGYVYTYMSSQEKGKKLIIHEHEGNGLYQELLIQNLEQYGSTNSYASGNISHNIWIEADATEVWVGYSPHLWTQKQVSDILSSIASRQLFMQPVDPAELVNCSESFSTQKNIMPLASLEQWVEEYKPADIRIDMSWSQGECYQTDLYTLKSMAGYFKQYAPKVPAVIALLDAEGIGTDLGSIAKLYVHQATDVKAQDNGSNLPLALQLDVSKLQQPSEAFHRKNVVSELIFNTLISLSASKKDMSLVDGKHDLSHYIQLTDKNKCKSGFRFAKRIKQQEFLSFLKEKKHIQDNLESLLEQVDLAATDHCAWLKTSEQKNQANQLSIACALSSYDRDVKTSAYSMELSFALIIDGVGFPLAGREDKDPRSALFTKWIDDIKSPLSKALIAYKPFAEIITSADSAYQPLDKDVGSTGGLLGASDLTIQEISKSISFMRITGGTDIIGKNIQTFILKKIKGEINLHADIGMLAQVKQGIQTGNIQTILGIIRTRYTDVKMMNTTQIQSDYELLVQSQMAEIIGESKSTINIKRKGKNGLKVISKTELLAKTNDNHVPGKIGTRYSLGAASVGLFIFSSIYFATTLKSLQKIRNIPNIINFVTSCLGALAGINALLVSVENLIKRNTLDKGIAFAGRAYNNRIFLTLSSRGFGAIAGTGALTLSFISDCIKFSNSQTDGRYFRISSAMANLGGGAALLFNAMITRILIQRGLVAVGAVMLGLPLVGWIVIIGLILTIIGIWLGLEADSKEHTPYERWVNRTIFGTLMRDEEDPNPLNSWETETKMLQAYFDIRYMPALVDPILAEELGCPDLYTEWIHSAVTKPQLVHFVLYFPDFQKNISNISEITQGYTIEWLPEISTGILLRFSKEINDMNIMEETLTLKYNPNTGYRNDICVEFENKLRWDWNRIIGESKKRIIKTQIVIN